MEYGLHALSPAAPNMNIYEKMPKRASFFVPAIVKNHESFSV